MNNKSILILKIASCVIEQNKVFIKDFYENYVEEEEQQKEEEYVVIKESLRAIGYKLNDKIVLTCDIKKHNLYTGNIGTITAINYYTNKVSVKFLLKQPLKPLNYRRSLNNLINIFARQA